ncbi:olfactory receptor 2A1/2A42-like [Orycteropus afer afer]|uniref:Olfactory receptor 2A1/2A42-like n=1 Tax=Orycteropus afer afer TaxID=1230840 RepID=A0A8B7B204_ORYAF|nr:olfactory receptor 2A1/2A42-like [Orycteropus afer afer]
MVLNNCVTELCGCLFNREMGENRTSITEFILLGFPVGTRLQLLLFGLFYVAICHPLRYSAIMSWRLCVTLAVTSWACASLLALVHVVLLLKLPFCGPHEINHFFCEIMSVLRLACADITLNHVVIFVACVFILVGPLFLVLVSYTHILFAILRIQSGEGRRKAFSTCSSHLCVVGLFFGSAIVMYMIPKASHSQEQQKVLFLFYSIFNPTLNPLIYSLRNADVKRALRIVLCKKSHSQLG